MAAISETELQKRLKKLESGITGSTPSANRVGATWEYANPVLYLAYAEGFAAGSLSDDGVVELQEYVNGFGFSPFNAAGSLKPWRGFLFSKSRYASGDPTDYIWEEVDVASANAQFERHYTVTPYLQAFVGSPSEAVTGVAWVSISVGTPIPDVALYVAERYEINGVMSQWVVYPVNSKETGTPLAYFAITGRSSIPALNSNEWDEDTILAMESHTGYPFSSVREFGYGTAVVIDYPPHGKQWGLYKRSSATGVGYWVTAQFVDGDLIVSDSIHASAIAANQIQANHLLVTGSNRITPATIEAATQVSMTAAEQAIITAQSTADGKIYTFYQNNEPTGMTIDNDGDFWVDTNAGNDLYRYDWDSTTSTGSWEDIANSDIAQAIQDAAGAQATADGKIRTFYQDSAPTGMVANDIGDLWVDLDDGNKLYRFNGSVWQAIQDSAITAAQNTADAAQTAQEVATAITNDTTVIDGARITTGTVNAARISLSPYQVGAGSITGSSRMEITSDVIKIYNGGTLRVKLGNLA